MNDEHIREIEQAVFYLEHATRANIAPVERIEVYKLISAYRTLQSMVAKLEEQNADLSDELFNCQNNPHYSPGTVTP